MKILFGIRLPQISACHLSFSYLFYNEQPINLLDENENNNLILAKAIWSLIQESPEYTASFLDGFAHPEQESPKLSGLMYTNYKEVRNRISQNIMQADKLFTALASDLSLTCIIPYRLYYKKIKNGEGRTLNGEVEVTLDYKISDPNGLCLADTTIFRPYPTTNLDDVISGFALGINGMRIGETREIYIHPKLAYGVYTTLDKAISLKAIIALREINNSKNGQYLTYNEHDFSTILDPTFEQKYSARVKDLGKLDGINLARHLKKSNQINLKKVLDNLTLFEQSSETSQDLSQEALAFLNRLHWNIYFGDIEFE